MVVSVVTSLTKTFQIKDLKIILDLYEQVNGVVNKVEKEVESLYASGVSTGEADVIEVAEFYKSWLDHFKSGYVKVSQLASSAGEVGYKDFLNLSGLVINYRMTVQQFSWKLNRSPMDGLKEVPEIFAEANGYLGEIEKLLAPALAEVRAWNASRAKEIKTVLPEKKTAVKKKSKKKNTDK